MINVTALVVTEDELRAIVAKQYAEMAEEVMGEAVNGDAKSEKLVLEALQWRFEQSKQKMMDEAFAWADMMLTDEHHILVKWNDGTYNVLIHQ
jgi:hypothetical protein